MDAAGAAGAAGATRGREEVFGRGLPSHHPRPRDVSHLHAMAPSRRPAPRLPRRRRRKRRRRPSRAATTTGSSTLRGTGTAARLGRSATKRRATCRAQRRSCGGTYCGGVPPTYRPQQASEAVKAATPGAAQAARARRLVAAAAAVVAAAVVAAAVVAAAALAPRAALRSAASV